MARRSNGDIARPNIEFSTVVHASAEMAGNDVGKMRPLATLSACDAPHMLGPSPSRLPDRSNDSHIAKVDTFHFYMRERARFVWSIEALLLRC